MSLRNSRRRATISGFLVVGLLGVVTACSLLIIPETTQCSVDENCVSKFGVGTTCDKLQGLCVQGSVVDAGPDVVLPEAQVPETQATETGTPCLDPSGYEGHGCYTCVPSTATTPLDLAIMNPCDGGECKPFNNTSRIPGYDGSLLPLPPKPAPFDAGTTSPVEAGVPTNLCGAKATQVVYIAGSSGLEGAQGSLFLSITKAWKSEGKDVAIVFQRLPSCDGLSTIYDNKSIAGQGKAWYPQMNSADIKGGESCDLDPAGQKSDLAFCDVPPSMCGYSETGGGNFVEFTGPSQVFMFAVPFKSNQYSISSEAARAAFGIGNAYASGGGPGGVMFPGVQPWTDEAHLYRRFEQSGNQISIGAFIGLKPDEWRGVRNTSGSAVATALLKADLDPTLRDKAIAITSADVGEDPKYLDTAGTTGALRVLSYQHRGQECGYLPNSSPESRDKRNVRYGKYYMHAPIHFFARRDDVDRGNKSLQELLNYLSFEKGVPLETGETFDYVTNMRTGGVIPACAMHVYRSGQEDVLHKQDPKSPCDCAFERANPPPECRSCKSSSECPSERSRCIVGFCEP